VAPAVPAEACVLAPLDGLDTLTVAGAELFGFVLTDVDGALLEVFTFTVVGAFTGGGFVGGGTICAAAGTAPALASNNASEPVTDPMSERFFNISAAPPRPVPTLRRAHITPPQVTRQVQARCAARALGYVPTHQTSLDRDARLCCRDVRLVVNCHSVVHALMTRPQHGELLGCS
jgi:hypothetical protein